MTDYDEIRPTLRIASAGALVCRGFNRYPIESDFRDYQQYLPYPVGNVGDMRDTRFDVEFESCSQTIARPTVMAAETAVSMAGVRTGGLEQLMHATGELTP